MSLIQPSHLRTSIHLNGSAATSIMLEVMAEHEVDDFPICIVAENHSGAGVRVVGDRKQTLACPRTAPATAQYLTVNHTPTSISSVALCCVVIRACQPPFQQVLACVPLPVQNRFLYGPVQTNMSLMSW